jgi:hypothetical protein
MRGYVASVCCHITKVKSIFSLLQLKELLAKLDESLKQKDGERKAYKEKHGIMTQEEREAMLKNQNKHIKK